MFHTNGDRSILSTYRSLGMKLDGYVWLRQVQRPHYMFQGLLNGLKLILKQSKIRHPVSLNCFKLYRQLKKNQALPLNRLQV